jgi:hypothetical protein
VRESPEAFWPGCDGMLVELSASGCQRRGNRALRGIVTTRIERTLLVKSLTAATSFGGVRDRAAVFDDDLGHVWPLARAHVIPNGT